MNVDQLKDKALNHCATHAKERLMGDLVVTAGNSLLERDDFQMRNVYTQAMIIWRKYGRIDIIQSETGALIGFVDHDKYLDVGAVWPTGEAALELVRKEGVVPESAKPYDYKTKESPNGTGKLGLYIFSLEKPEKEYDLLEVEINCAKQAIISVKPKRSERFHG